MNSTTQSITQELNTLIFPIVSVTCQIIMALVLFCIKRLETSNYMRLREMQESILETVSNNGQLSTSRQETQHINEPYEEEPTEPASTHRDIPLNNDYVLRIKKK